MVASGDKMEGDVADGFRVLRGVCGQALFELAFFHNGVYIMIFCNVTEEVPPHTRFRTFVRGTGVAA